MRTVPDESPNGHIPRKTLITCIDGDMETLNYMVETGKFDQKYFIVGKYTVTTMVKEDGRTKPKNTMEVLMTSKFASDYQTHLVKSDTQDINTIVYTLKSLTEQILRKGDEVYISIANGTGEFCVAACIVGMGYEKVSIISKKVTEDLNFQQFDANPDAGIMMLSQTMTVTKIKGIEIELPDQVLIDALDVFNKASNTDRKNNKMIQLLIENKVWFALKGLNVPEDGVSGTSAAFESNRALSEDDQHIIYNEKNYYQRNVLGKWLKNNWIKRNDRAPSGYEMSDEGLRILSMFKGDGNPIKSEMLINPLTNDLRLKKNAEYLEERDKIFENWEKETIE